MTASGLYFHVSAALEKNAIEDSRFEAMCIAEHVSGMKLPELLMERNPVDEEMAAQADAIIRRRISGEPLQYILGEWEFYGMPFYVGEGVLIPRADTETLVEYTIESAENYTSPKILDLCSGSGCIAAAVSRHVPSAKVTAVELSEEALGFLRKNVERNNADVKIIKGDVLSVETAESIGRADIIVCNPPYLTAEDMKNLQREVRYEPETALFGGDDGLDFYREITRIWKNNLEPGGMLAYEIGMGQEKDAAEILHKNGFEKTAFRNDLAGITRVVSGILV